MSELFIYSMIMVGGIILSAFSQIILKKSARREYSVWWREYINLRVIAAYSIFVITTFISIFAYRVVPLSTGPILSSTEYIFVAVLSYFLLKERMKPRTLVGMLIIVSGIIIFSLG